MRRVALLIAVMIFLYLPFDAYAGRLYIKMAFGLVSGGDITDNLISPSGYSDYISLERDKKSVLGQSICLEIIYQLNRYLSFSLGNGYLYKILKGNKTEFTPPETGSFKGNFVLSPEFSVEAIPIWLSVMFSFPVNSFFQVNLSSGVGYYFGTFESRSRWRLHNYPEFSTWQYHSWNFKGDGRAFGLHVGAGFEVFLSERMSLTGESIYRSLNFTKVKSSGVMGVDTTFYYLQFYEGYNTTTNLDYRVSSISLSGVSFQAGLKFKF